MHNFLRSMLYSLRQVKGQLISKGLFGIHNSSKNQTKKFDLTMIAQVDLFSRGVSGSQNLGGQEFKFSVVFLINLSYKLSNPFN